MKEGLVSQVASTVNKVSGLRIIGRSERGELTGSVLRNEEPCRGYNLVEGVAKC